MGLSPEDIRKILQNELEDPFSVLGMHWEDTGISIRAFLPRARTVVVVRRGTEERLGEMNRVNEQGVFELHVANQREFFPYEYIITLQDGTLQRLGDPYSFGTIISEQSLYLFNEGNNQKIYEDMGSHIRVVDGVKGVIFAVWAPNAKRVSVVGNFNNWDGRCHPMRRRGNSGVWEIFIPGLDEGTIYKYEIKKRENNHLVLKTDPYGYYQEPPPNHATIVYDIDKFQWTDEAFMKARAEAELLDRPMSIYEVHLGSWRKCGPRRDGDWLSYQQLAHQLADYVNKMGFTHVELMPIQDHPYVPSWGYQVGGFYAPNHRFGAPDDFQYFVNYLHNKGIGVIIDWVPGHFPKDSWALAYFDGTYLYEHQHPYEREHKDWGTLIFNFGRYEVRNFLVANALYWLDKYHIDGLRVDAVASMLYRDYSRKEGEWIPNKYGGKENLEAIEFLRTMNTLVHNKFPGAVTLAEESTAWPMVSRPVHSGGLGFTFKWNMGWMHDVLYYFSRDPVYRKYHQNQITFGLWYAFHENFVLMVSHDEVVHCRKSLLEKMPGDTWQKFANVRAFLGFMFGHPGKKHLFQGCEFGMHWEWDAEQSINWHILTDEPDASFHRGLQKLVSDLNNFYRNEPVLWERDFVPTGFEWIDNSDREQSVISFLRRGNANNKIVIFVCNFTPVVRYKYRIGVPYRGDYELIINTDDTCYGGSGVNNSAVVTASDIPMHNRPHSLELTLPPLAVMIFRWSQKEEIRN